MALRDDLILERDLSYLFYGGWASFFATVVLFRFVSPAISGLLWPSYKLLPRHAQGEWNDRFVSNINAMVCIGFSYYTLLHEAGMVQDHVWYDSVPARLACALVVGYMIADLLLMAVYCQPSKGEMIGYICHHAATVYAYSLISAYGVLCYFGMLRLIAEMSTPAVNQRWYFDRLEVPRSNICVLLNGLIMVVSFFLFRMVTMPIYWFQIWQVTGIDAVLKLGHIQLIMYIPTFVLDVLNVWWFYKMVKGFWKALKLLTRDPDKDMKLKSV